MFKHGMVLGAAVACALSLVAMPALAADDDHDSGFYLGAALGDFSANYQNGNDATSQHLTFNRNDATRIMAGWRFLPYLAVQLDYSDYGRSQAAINEAGFSTKTTAWTPSVLGILPIGPVELFAKAGESFYNVHLNDNTGRLVNDSGNNPVYGVGVGVTIIKRLNLSAEYERIKLNNFDKPDAVWLNASWRFGNFR